MWPYHRFVAPVCLFLEPSVYSCTAAVWCGFLGTTVSLTPLFLKMWKVHKLANNKQLKKIKFSKQRQLQILALLNVIPAAYLATVQARAHSLDTSADTSLTLRHRAGTYPTPPSTLPSLVPYSHRTLTPCRPWPGSLSRCARA